MRNLFTLLLLLQDTAPPAIVSVTARGDAGHVVVVFSKPLEQVAADRPALILLDLMMPGMNGFEFIAELRQRDAVPGIPIVVLTAKDLTAEERQRLNGYVERVLQKGACSREQLLSEMEALRSTADAPQ